MTKTIEQKEQFIQLRARGYSFDKIAEELEVSKPTLIKWQGEFLEEVKEAQFHEFDNLMNEYRVHRAKRFENNCRILNACYEELESRFENFERLSISELVKLIELTEKKLEEESERSAILIEVPESWKLAHTKWLEL